MAFFDDISQKLSSIGQTAVQKTKDVTGLAKMNSALYDEEKKSNNLFKEIGKLYFKLHSDDCEEPFRDYINALKESQEKIETFKKQIQEAKGYVRCPNCGGEVMGNAAFCSVCGQPMPRPTPQPQNNAAPRCSGCGQLVPPGMKFCTVCGTPVPEMNNIQGGNMNMPGVGMNMNIPGGINNVQYPASAPMNQPQTAICKNCGGVLEPNSKFCVLCGARIDV